MKLPEALATLVSESFQSLARDRPAEAIADLARAADSAAGLGQEEVELGLRIAAATLRATVDGPAAVVDSLGEIGDRAKARGFDRLLAAAMIERGDLLRALGRFDEAARHGNAMFELGDRINSPEIKGAAALSLGVTLRQMGRLEEARQVLSAGFRVLVGLVDAGAESVLRLGEIADPSWAFTSTVLELARVALGLGAIDRARGYLDGAATRPLDPLQRASADAIAVELARREGRSSDGAALARSVDALAVAGPSEPLVDLLCQRALAAATLGEALALLDRAEEAARKLARAPLAGVGLTRALVLKDAGRLAEAEAALPDAAAMAETPALKSERALLAATLALAAGRPSLAMAPAIEAAARAEARGDLAGAAAAHQLVAILHRTVGAVIEAAAHRRRAAELYVRCGLRARLPALEVERAYTLLIEGDRDGADAVLAPLGVAGDDDLAAQVALCAASVALARGTPGAGMERLVEAHARAVRAGENLTGAALAFALKRLAGEADLPLPSPVAATLEWATVAGVPITDPLHVPPPITTRSNS